MLPVIPIAILIVAGYGLFRFFSNGQNNMQSIDQTITQTVEDVTKSISDLFPKAAPYENAIVDAENKYNIPNNYLAKLLNQESRFRPDIITGQTRSRTGATGIAQFMPDTAKELGVNPLDPMESIDGAARYLNQLFNKFGNWTEAIAAYNWGQGNVQRKGLEKAPQETVDYVQSIVGVDIKTKG